MVITQATFQNSINPENIRFHGHTSGHNIPLDIMLNLPEMLRNPIMIIQGNKENSVLVVTDTVNLDGKNVVIPVSFDKRLGFYLVNSVDSIYPKERLRNYIDKAINNNKILAQNKEKANNLLRSIGCQSSKENTVISFNNSIAYTTDNVKYPEKNIAETKENSPVGNSVAEKPAEKAVQDNSKGKDFSVQVDSMKGVYPDDVGASYEDELSDGTKYQISQNIDRYKLANEGVYLGNAEKEQKPQVSVAEKSQLNNFHITDENLGTGGAKAKFRNNIVAIKTVKQIELEKRLATPEEQEVLSKYVGWGGLPQAFDENN